MLMGRSAGWSSSGTLVPGTGEEDILILCWFCLEKMPEGEERADVEESSRQVCGSGASLTTQQRAVKCVCVAYLAGLKGGEEVVCQYRESKKSQAWLGITKGFNEVRYGQ